MGSGDGEGVTKTRGGDAYDFPACIVVVHHGRPS